MLPLAGAALGGLAALVLTISSAAHLPPELASALAIGALVLLTGALHEDGLADCADGLGGGTARERKLEIMRDSRVGTYGAIAIALTLYLRIESLAAIMTHSLAQAAMASIAAGAVSRAAALVPLYLLAPARTDGSGHSAGRPEARAMVIALVVAGISAFIPVFVGADPRAALLAVVGAATVAIGATGFAYRQIGGQTGDIAGAVQQLAEVSVLLAFSAG